ncbi:hypothetical protein BT96DRAFT_988144 [Gymnopus androsaceus JB14]|uniref:Uncharacterized protein n=1 Tax=Gymnopus androsaceus JB14 TaxID=1447944 RepID=A0A6A4I5U5_9AGAR|nr:hypothetical protein BT96DRAFT_988144 [Gymnopus androsaceus JB14]
MVNADVKAIPGTVELVPGLYMVPSPPPLEKYLRSLPSHSTIIDIVKKILADESRHGKPSLPAMIWSTNYGRLLFQTVFTMFFAGRDFLPKCILDGVNIQDYLQSHFIEPFGQLAGRIRDTSGLLEECVIGWDSINEAFEGFCGWEDVDANPTRQGYTYPSSILPSQHGCLINHQSLVDAYGIENDNGPSKMGLGERPWMEARDVYMAIWDLDTGDVLRPEDLEPMDEGKTSSSPVKPPVFTPPPPIPKSSLMILACTAAQASPDTTTTRTLLLPVFAIKIGEAVIRKSIQEQLGILKANTLTITRGEGIYPTIMDADVDSSKHQLQQQGLENKDYDSLLRLQLQQQGGDEEKNRSKLSNKYQHGIAQKSVHPPPHPRAALSLLSVPPLPHLIPNLRRTSPRIVSCLFPVKTIVTPSDIQFDIANLATEIFVPVVHYARPRLLASSSSAAAEGGGFGGA